MNQHLTGLSHPHLPCQTYLQFSHCPQRCNDCVLKAAQYSVHTGKIRENRCGRVIFV